MRSQCACGFLNRKRCCVFTCRAIMGNLYEFSPDGEFWAHLSPDGCLQIWDTNSNTLKQEYTPSSHLTSTCVTMAWCPLTCLGKSPKKKKLKNNIIKSLDDLKLTIAMGSLLGDVLLYNVNKGDLHTKMSNGHSDVVTGISWFPDEDSIFTCSKDRYIVHWSISKSTVHTKWKAGKTALHSIVVIDANNLLCASNEICWWNIKSQTLIKKFTGHATEVFSLIPIHLSSNSSDLTYFISTAINDRVVNVWQMEESDFCNSVASFALSEEPETLNVSRHVIKQEPLVLSVVTRSGLLHIFQHQLNGRIKKPLAPKSTVHLVSMAKNEEKSKPISIFSSKCVQTPDTFKLSYGTFLNPTFEITQLNLSEKDQYLIRELTSFSDDILESISKTKVPERPKDAKMLAPGYMAPSKPTDSVIRKKKRKSSSSKELPMEEKLNALYLGQIPQNEEVQDTPTSNSMVHLLLQGLQSKDISLLNTVLKKSDEDVIKNTVKRLPLNSIPLLLTELHRRLTLKEQDNRPCLRWLKTIFSIHLSYLMSLQEIDEYIGPVSQLIEAREETFSKMCQLKGFLDILWSQVDSKASESSFPSKALAEYNDSETSSEGESSEEEMEDDRNKLEQELQDNSSSNESSDDDFKFQSSGDEMEVL